MLRIPAQDVLQEQAAMVDLQRVLVQIQATTEDSVVFLVLILCLSKALLVYLLQLNKFLLEPHVQIIISILEIF